MTETLPQRAMDRMGGQDMAVPEIKLVQNTGGGSAKDQGAKPGDFFLSLTDEVIKGDSGFDVVIVDMLKTRTYWGRADISSEPPECGSMDAETMKSIDGKDCAKCEHKLDVAWAVSASERRGKCNISFNIMGILLPDEKRASAFPVLMRVSGISTKSAKEMLTQLRLNRSLKGEYHRAVVHVTSETKKTASGEAFAYHFRLKTVLAADTDQAKELDAESKVLLASGATAGAAAALLNEGQAEDQAALEPAKPPPDVGI